MKRQVAQFLNYMVHEKNCSANTTAAYQNDLSQFLEFLENYSTPVKPEISGWGDVDDQVVQNYLLFLKERDYASSTVARKVASVKSFLHFLVSRGYLGSDPSDNLDSPKVKKNLPRSIKPDEIDRFMNAPSDDNAPKSLRDKALLEMLYATGMRVTELVSLNVDNVDLESGNVLCGEGGKRERTVPIYDNAADAVDGYIRDGRPQLLVRASEPALFLNHRGRRLTRQGLWLIIKHYVQEVGIETPVTPHTLRHSFATHMLNSGAELREVQERLGHASSSTTQVYRQVSDSDSGGSELVIDGQEVNPQDEQRAGTRVVQLPSIPIDSSSVWSPP